MLWSRWAQTILHIWKGHMHKQPKETCLVPRCSPQRRFLCYVLTPRKVKRKVPFLIGRADAIPMCVRCGRCSRTLAEASVRKPIWVVDFRVAGTWPPSLNQPSRNMHKWYSKNDTYTISTTIYRWQSTGNVIHAMFNWLLPKRSGDTRLCYPPSKMLVCFSECRRAWK